MFSFPRKPAGVDVIFTNGSPEESFASIAGGGSVVLARGPVSANGAPGGDGTDGDAGHVAVVAVATGR